MPAGRLLAKRYRQAYTKLRQMNLKRLAEISPVIGSFLIFIGYLRLHLYYSNWDINIANYLDFSEITLSFLNDTNTILFFILILLFQMTIGVATLVTVDKKIKADSTQAGEKEFPGIFPMIDKGIEEHYKPAIIGISIVNLLFFFLFLWFLNLTFLYITFAIFIQLLVLLLDKIIGIKDDKSLIQTSFVIVLLSFTYCLSKYNVKQTEICTKRTVLNTNSNEKISTSENFIFLGKTNNYYFFYDKIKKQSTIIEGGSVLKVITSENYEDEQSKTTTVQNKKENIDTLAKQTSNNYYDTVVTIYFDHGSSSIKSADLSKLKKLADLCAIDTIRYFKIVAFTDTIGSETQNDKLAEKRAMKVFKNIFADEKIGEKRSYVTWLGESEEVYDLHFEPIHPHQNCVDIWFQLIKPYKNASR